MLTSKGSQESDIEQALWLHWNQSGSEKARWDLIDFYRSWIISLAKKLFFKIRPQNLELSDFIQQGILGALDSIERFDLSYQSNFKSFAKDRIRGEILNSIEKYSEEYCLKKKQLLLQDRLCSSEDGELFEQLHSP